MIAYRFSLVGLAALASLLLMLRNKIKIVKYYYQDLSFEKSCMSRDYLWSSFFKVTLEIILIWLFPYPYSSSEFSVTHKTDPKIYNLDQFFTLLSLGKSFFVLRLIPHITAVKSNASKKLYDLNGVPINNSLFVRVQFKERPLMILGCSLLLCTIVFGFGM